MLQRYSEQLTEFLMVKGIIESENREIYEYGFVALLSTVINIIIVLLSQIDKESSIRYLNKFEEIAKDIGFYF